MNKKKSSQDSLARSRMKKRLLLVGGCVLLAGLFSYTVFKGDSEEKQVEEMASSIARMTSGNIRVEDVPGKLIDSIAGKRSNSSVPKERSGEFSEIRKNFKKLSPSTRKKIVRRIMKKRLEELRKQTAGLTDEQKKEMVDEMIEKTRDRFSKMDSGERDKAREKMNKEKTKEDTEEALDFYYNEFSGKERELYDPLVAEMMNNLNSL